MRYLALLLLISASAFGAKTKKGETINYLCIGQGVGPKGGKAPSAETRVRIQLPEGKRSDRLKEPTDATATLFSLQLHDSRGGTQKLGKSIALRGHFEIGKAEPRAGHNFDAKIPKGELIREIHINMGNTGRRPSWMKVARGKKLVEHYMLCQWE